MNTACKFNGTGARVQRSVNAGTRFTMGGTLLKGRNTRRGTKVKETKWRSRKRAGDKNGGGAMAGAGKKLPIFVQQSRPEAKFQKRWLVINPDTLKSFSFPRVLTHVSLFRALLTTP